MTPQGGPRRPHLRWSHEVDLPGGRGGPVRCPGRRGHATVRHAAGRLRAATGTGAAHHLPGVSPAGLGTEDGSTTSPLPTIQAGLDRVEPGTQITLAPGVYRDELHTVRAGTPDTPIWIKAP